MRRTSAFFASLVGVCTALACGVAVRAGAQHTDRHDERALLEDPRLSPGQIAPVLEGLGDHHHPVTTKSERAQAFFDQGLKLTYGFNHQEALRAFKEAARLDPECAMAYWGWALVLGPNLNLPMQAEVVPQASKAIQLALQHKDGVSERDRDYIDALATRHAEDPPADRAPLDAAYAEAMRRLHEKYPEDLDAATLYAAALMNLSPWDYWGKDGRPKEHTPEILRALEAVLERDPRHQGALHYYIHAVEAADARRGEAAADQLRGLAPGAGHLMHMPSHIYMQLGRYAEGYEVNTLAAKADEGYIAQCRAQGIYPLGYYPHNVHFLAWAAIMQGRRAAAIEASRKVASKVPEDHHGDHWALYQTFLSMPLYTMVRFGSWEEILGEPRPPRGMRYWTGIGHYARGMAYVHTNRADEAGEELTALARIADDPETPEVLVGFSNAGALLTVAKELLAGELAAERGRYDEAIGHLDRAVRFEDSLVYSEPPDWYYPVRHTLGAVLLEAGRFKEAEIVYWQDLRKNQENGYALYGLWQSLKSQGRSEDAAEIERRFRTAWRDADVELVSSRF
jgi:tetratricopeptide (TPR) repeat protein